MPTRSGVVLCGPLVSTAIDLASPEQRNVFDDCRSYLVPAYDTQAMAAICLGHLSPVYLPVLFYSLVACERLLWLLR